MPKPIKKRVSKKTENESTIAESVTDIRKKLKERQRTLVFGFIICGLIIISVGSFFIYNRAQSAKAEEMEYEGYKILSGSSTAAYASPQDRFKNALEKFKASYAAKKNPSVLLYIASCCYELGNFDEGFKALSELTSQYSNEKIISLAYYKMAMGYVRKGDMDNALKTFGNLSKIKDAPLQDMALLESGKILESMGKTNEAKGKYKELVTRFPKSPLFNDAKARL